MGTNFGKFRAGSGKKLVRGHRVQARWTRIEVLNLNIQACLGVGGAWEALPEGALLTDSDDIEVISSHDIK